ncbi:MAG: hypothetical protein KKC19_04560 [Nanoarchaeota archaeon]|nr:hypothetical protein [Nanoarchaeota archaeon]
MELNITNETENLLFDRREIYGNIKANSTPSRVEVTKALAEKFSTPEDNIKIKKIEGKFGAQTFDVEANIYTSKENKDKVEIKKKKDEKVAEPAAPKEELIPAAKVEGGSGGAPFESTSKETPKKESKPKEESKK